MQLLKRFFSFLFLLSIPVLASAAQFNQQTKLVPLLDGVPAAGVNYSGWSVSLSADGNTALVGAPGGDGRAWLWGRTSGTWTQGFGPIVGPDKTGVSTQGTAVALSADGNTALIGGSGDNGGVGAAWVWTRSGSIWIQQGPKLVGTGGSGVQGQGYAVALSADGNTALVGGFTDNSNSGAVWVWTRSGGVWTQQGNKLVGTGATTPAKQGISVALSADGNTAIVGGFTDGTGLGAVWVWTRSGGVWTQQGSKLTGSGATANAAVGSSVAVSGDGNTLIAGGSGDNSGVGAAWVWTRSGSVWTQQGSKLVGTVSAVGSQQGYSVALSSDGNTAAVGGPGDGSLHGAVWTWTRTGGTWTQLGPKLVGGSDSVAAQGYSVALSSDGSTLLFGGPYDTTYGGSAWVFVQSGVTHFAVSAPASATSGTAFNFTVTAQDVNNNVITGYGGTVHFTSSDGSATLPGDATLSNGTGTFSATLRTNGNQTVTATDTLAGSVSGTSGGIAVSGGLNVHFVVSAPASATAGTALNFTVNVRDGANNPVTSYSGTIHFASSDSQAALPANAPVSNGTGTFSATLKTAGSQTITATDTVSSTITGTSGGITVGAAAATHLAVTAPASAIVATPFNFTVAAQDAYNNTSSAYAGTVHFTSSDGQAALPANATLTNGTGTFSATLKTPGNQSITATDTATASIAGSSGSIAVTAGQATKFAVSAPSASTTGSPLNFTVTAQDAANNTITTYTGTVHFTSSDAQAVLPANATLTNGTGVFSATLTTAGNQSITATDTATATITGNSGAISVGAATIHFAVTAPASAAVGTPFNVTVTAQDAANNTVANYAGTVHFTSSDAQAVLPANSTLTSGTKTFQVTLKTSGNQYISATDTVTATFTGSSGIIAVGSAAATHFTISAPSSATAGTPFSFTVTAKDAQNNTATGYAGIVHFTSTDAAAVLPADALLTNGIGSASATLKTGGNQTITATDTVSASITGTSGTIAVTVAALPHFAVSAPASVTAGTPFNFTVTAQDSANSTLTSYAGTVHFTSTDGAAVLPANATLSNGTGTFPATLNTFGNQSITATDTASASMSGQSGNIAVGGGTAPAAAIPGAGSSYSTSMTFTFTDPRGWQDLDVVNVLINNFLDGRNACYLAYSRSASVLYLVSDGGGALLQGLALNGTGSTSNSQCTVTGAGSSATGSGNTLTLTLNLSFSTGFTGHKVTYMAARDLQGGNSGWQALGTWEVPGTVWSGPHPDSVTPARSSGSGTRSLLFQFSDTNGWADLGILNILINDALDGNHGCYLAYDRANNVLYLVNDAGNGLLPGMVINGNGSLSNGQCTVTGSGSSVAAGGNTLILTLNMSFTPAFAGSRVIYMAARSNGDLLNSGWRAEGSRTVQ